MATDNTKGLTELDLTLGAVGIFCPFPVIGEAALAGFLYKPIKEGLNADTGLAVLASIPAAILTRAFLYKDFYIPVLNFTANYLPHLQLYLDTINDFIS